MLIIQYANVACIQSRASTFTYWKDVDIHCCPMKATNDVETSTSRMHGCFQSNGIAMIVLFEEKSAAAWLLPVKSSIPTSRHRQKSIKGTNRARLFSVSDFYCSQTISQTLWTTQKNMTRDWNRIRREIVGSDSIRMMNNFSERSWTDRLSHRWGQTIRHPNKTRAGEKVEWTIKCATTRKLIRLSLADNCGEGNSWHRTMDCAMCCREMHAGNILCQVLVSFAGMSHGFWLF